MRHTDHHPTGGERLRDPYSPALVPEAQDTHGPRGARTLERNMLVRVLPPWITWNGSLEEHERLLSQSQSLLPRPHVLSSAFR